jgi:hypothetical protein
MMTQKEQLSPDQVYVQFVDASELVPNAGKFIVTMFRDLAGLVHSATFTLHDCTYKRVADPDIKEWEVVIWCSYLNERTYLIF